VVWAIARASAAERRRAKMRSMFVERLRDTAGRRAAGIGEGMAEKELERSADWFWWDGGRGARRKRVTADWGKPRPKDQAVLLVQKVPTPGEVGREPHLPWSPRRAAVAL